MHELRKDMQMIFQDPYASLNPRMTILDSVKASLDVYKIGTPREREEKAAALLEYVGLKSGFLYKTPQSMSGGQRQRVVIARAIIMEPSFIVCDEPVSALDVSVQAQVLNLMKRIQKEKGLSYLFISHDLSVVRYLCTKVAVMYLGRIVEIADKTTIFTRPLHPYTKTLLSAIPIPDAEAKSQRIILQGDLPSPVNPPSGCRFHTRCPYAKEECSEVKEKMKEVEPGTSYPVSAPWNWHEGFAPAARTARLSDNWKKVCGNEQNLSQRQHPDHGGVRRVRPGAGGGRRDHPQNRLSGGTQEAFPDAEMVDLEGKTLMPGFVCGHGHLSMAVQMAQKKDLGHCAGFEQIEDELRAYIRENGYGRDDVAVGYNFDHNAMPGYTHLNRTVLNRVSTVLPVCVFNTSFHIGYANDAALQAAGITAATPDPQGGKIGRDPETGEPTGYLEETALYVLYAVTATRTKYDPVGSLRMAQEMYFSHGVTTAQDGAANAETFACCGRRRRRAAENRRRRLSGRHADARELCERMPNA
jgi:oligopeptide/dipeptide ABC transporter ATP-binding protein